jgi:ligand-binding sensor domain-containing protein
MGEDLWVGTLYGLSRYSEDLDDWITLTTFEGLADNWVTDIVPDRDALWVGTSLGASMVDLRGDSVLVAEIPMVGKQKVYDIEAGPEFIWFGTDHGVYALDKQLNRWLKFTSPDGTIERTVTAISAFGDEVWFATTVGLTLYQRDSGKWRWHPLHGQLQAGHIICLEAGEQAVWAGSESGLWKLRRRTGRWRAFTTEDGLLDNMVQVMVLDGAYIWLGTPRGLTRFFWDNPLRID